MDPLTKRVLMASAVAGLATMMTGCASRRRGLIAKGDPRNYGPNAERGWYYDVLGNRLPTVNEQWFLNTATGKQERVHIVGEVGSDAYDVETPAVDRNATPSPPPPVPPPHLAREWGTGVGGETGGAGGNAGH